MEGKIIFEGMSRKKTSFVIRYATKQDAGEMCRFNNVLSQEKSFISLQGEIVSLKDEQKSLAERLKKVKEHTGVLLLAIKNNVVIGISEVELKDLASKHQGIFSISLAKQYRSEGIGRDFMNVVLEEAEKCLLGLKIITLGVFGNNHLAKGMYETFGFKQYAYLPEGVLHKGKYVSHISMYKKIR